MDVGEDGTMADHLADSGVRPAGVFLSHPHADHAGGLKEILELCPPSVLYLPCLWHETDADDGVPELIEAAVNAGWTVQTLEAGDVLRLSDHVSARVIQPFSDMDEDANGASLCLLVSLGEGSVLFAGDLTKAAECAFFPDCDVLKIPHHGAKSSTSSLLLQMTTPSAAIISVGHNSYGHPSEETLARLNAAGAEVFRTDECGAISALLGPDGLVRITPMNLPNQSEAHP
jgi:beta-lactamase superfamily II metal-dependent hydrolase